MLGTRITAYIAIAFFSSSMWAPAQAQAIASGDTPEANGAGVFDQSAPSFAQADEQRNRWEVVVNPYFMAPSSGGKFGVGPLETNIDSSAADLFKRLNWAVLGAVEVGNGDISFGFDVNYINIDVARGERGPIKVDGHQAAYTFMVFKRIDQHAEVYAGLRITDFGLRLRCSGTCPRAEGSILDGGVTRNRSWSEPLIGLRVRDELSPRLDVMVMADVGGFSVGSDFSANVWPQIGYRFGERTRLMAGYRIIYVQFDEGEGRERFLFDAVTHNPTLKLKFHF